MLNQQEYRTAFHSESFDVRVFIFAQGNEYLPAQQVGRKCPQRNGLPRPHHRMHWMPGTRLDTGTGTGTRNTVQLKLQIYCSANHQL